MKKVIVHHHSFLLALQQSLASRTKHMFPYTDVSFSGYKRHIEAVQLLWSRGCYERIAEFNYPEAAGDDDSDICEHAWTYSQNLDPRGWIVNMLGHNKVHVSQARSSMVGDIFEVVYVNGISKLYRVDGIGFKPLEEYTPEQIKKLEAAVGYGAQ